MIETLTQNDLLLLFRLLAAYMIAEWLFPKVQVKTGKHKKLVKFRQWAVQGIAAGVLTYLLAGAWKSLWLPLVVLSARVAGEWLRDKKEKSLLRLTFIPVFYLVILVGCWLMLVKLDISDIIFFLETVFSNVKIWIIVIAYIFVVWPVGAWIGKITEPWRKELKESDRLGLEKAGLWMGRLERILILTFILLNEYSVIGFIITAKSIFRFPDLKDKEDRKENEYILIGSMLSFTIVVIAGIFISWLLKK